MTVAANSNNVSQTIPIGLVIQTGEWGPEYTGLILDRRNAAWLAKRLADNLFYKTADHYRYMGETSGKEDLAQSIEFDLHVILNQLRVEHLYCEHCGKNEQEHRWGGWCPHYEGAKGSTKWQEKSPSTGEPK
jgi:hypothetical protein